MGEDAGSHFAVAIARKCSNENPSELIPTALPPALAKLRQTYDQTVRFMPYYSGLQSRTCNCTIAHSASPHHPHT